MSLLSILCIFFALGAAAPQTGKLVEGVGNSFPFQAAIFRNVVESFYEAFVCDGVLISDRYILTTASCIDGVDFHNGIMKIVVGRRHENPNILTQQGFLTTQFVIHEEFQRDGLKNNIAIIKLMGKHVVKFNDYVKAVNLPLSSMENEHTGKSANVSSWDWRKIPFDLPPILYYGTVTAIDNSNCIDKNTGHLVDNAVLCTVNEQYPCQDAPGSPLTIHNELLGLLSWIYPSGCHPDKPTGFVRIDEYLEWINEKMLNM